jgi:hypothetical protein
MRKQLFITVCLLAIAAPWAAASTVAYWRFEAGPAGTDVLRTGGDGYTFSADIPDVSGNGNHLAVWSTGGGSGYGYRSDLALSRIPQTGAANQFSVKNTGGGPAMFTRSSQSLPTGKDLENITFSQFTIEAFFKPETGGWRTIVGRDSTNVTGQDTSLAAVYFQITPDHALAIKFADAQRYWHAAQSANGAIQGFTWGTDPDGLLGKWYYAAAVSDGATLSLYLANITDGTDLQLVAQTNIAASGSTNTSIAKGTTNGGDWHAGGWSVGRGLYNGGHGDRAYGFIDEVRISDVALAPEYFLINSRLGAWNPSPAKGTGNYGFTPDGTTVTANLSWNTGVNPSNPEQTNPAILKHYLYVSKDRNKFSDPNLFWVMDITAVGSTGQAAVAGLNFDGLYQWRVDEAVDKGGGVPSGRTDPNTIVGPVWSFGTLLSVPVITQQPVSVLTGAGETVQFTVAASSLSPVQYQWFKSADNANNTFTDDQAVGSSSYVGTLTLTNVQAANEGYYYSRLKNTADGYVYSNTVRLGIRRLVSRWTLDQADYVGGQYRDISGEGHHADPNGAPTFVAGQLGQGVSIPRAFGERPSTNSWARAGTWNPSEFSGQLTVSFWMKWAGLNGTWQGFITKRVASTWSNANVLWQVSSDNGLPHLWFQSPRSLISVANGLVAGQWQYIVATYDGTTGRIYINGEQRASGAFQFGDAVSAMICLGGNSFEIGGQEWMNGDLDDVKFFNYAVGELDVAQMYVADAPDKTACLQSQKPDVRFDLNNDCKVDVNDFAIFAETWLDSGLIGGN